MFKSAKPWLAPGSPPPGLPFLETTKYQGWSCGVLFGSLTSESGVNVPGLGQKN